MDAKELASKGSDNLVLNTVDNDGNIVDGAGSEMDPFNIEVIELRLPAVEAALATCLNDVKSLIDALGEMVHVSVEGSKLKNLRPEKQLSSDHADSTVKLLRNRAKIALAQCGSIPESDTRLLAARAMLASFYDAICAVNIERDSVPGIRLGRVFLACCHVVLSAKEPAARKHEALMKWRANRKEIMSRV